MKKYPIILAAAVLMTAAVLSVARLSAQDTITVPKLRTARSTTSSRSRPTPTSAKSSASP